MPAPPVDKSSDRVRDMFGQIARRYDFLNHLLSGGTDIYWRWRTVRRVAPKGNLPILDVCSGTGDLAIAYWRKASGRTPIFAADFCHEMLVLGARKAAKLGGYTENSLGGARHGDGGDRSASVTFLEADTQQLPLPSDCFQIVSVAFGLRNVADTDRGLAEMARVCAPGGKVAVLEFSMPRRQPFRGLYRWYFRHVLPRVGQFFSRNDADAYRYLPESVGQFPSGEELAERMRGAGLTDIKCYPLTLGVATLYVGTADGGITSQTAAGSEQLTSATLQANTLH